MSGSREDGRHRVDGEDHVAHLESSATSLSALGIASQVCRHYGVVAIGQTDAVRERYHALSAERRVTHPGVVALTTAARAELSTPDVPNKKSARA